jgi:site-specific DNA-methyltransferase (adenine-specific)
MNRLLFGDNLKWLRDTRLFPDASVDLVYLDPPFNSNADYNVLFRETSGEASQAQFHAFSDTWNWADAAQTYADFVDGCPNSAVVEMMDALHDFLRNSPMMAYLAMMAPRLVELHRVLKTTGSLYLHCDPTASHYLRMLLDGIFGQLNFQNEMIWPRTNAHNIASKHFSRVHDIIYFYSKTNRYTWNHQFGEFSPQQLARYFPDPETGRLVTGQDLTMTGNKARNFKWRGTRPPANRGWGLALEELEQLWADGMILKKKDGSPRLDGKKVFLDEKRGKPVSDIWMDIERVGNTARERLGYATQKPQALLERIIQASSNPGDLVLDPFCGCGTSVHAAHKLGRQWIGIDVTYLAINLIKRRLKDAFGDDAQFEERGQPTDFESAKALAKLDKWQFQQWALSLIEARPRAPGDGKGADRGVDGLLFFYESREKREKILVQVKGGGVQRGDVARLLGDVNNQKFAGGILITLEKPTKPMREEAADAGRYQSKLWHDKDYPKIQILTIDGLLGGAERVEAPPQMNPFAKAQREGKPEKQPDLM